MKSGAAAGAGAGAGRGRLRVRGRARRVAGELVYRQASVCAINRRKYRWSRAREQVHGGLGLEQQELDSEEVTFQ